MKRQGRGKRQQEAREDKQDKKRQVATRKRKYITVGIKMKKGKENS